jgi:hypothetical protein
MIKFTVSVSGVVTIRSDETQMLLWRAEEALDAATKAGGNCCCFYNAQRAEIAGAAVQHAPCQPA